RIPRISAPVKSEISSTLRNFTQISETPKLAQPKLLPVQFRRPLDLIPKAAFSTTVVKFGILGKNDPKSNVQNVTEDDMLKGIWSDMRTIRETFALDKVPKEVFWFGMGGLVPYVVTSFTTIYLAWDINYAAAHGAGYLVSRETADHLLHILEPTQIGLGAIILSFLGAVHWGLEMARYGGSFPYYRYGIGVLAPALAWPTVVLPLNSALMAQFIGFVGMYFADSQATIWGWAPNWYSTYRFILTFVVGACVIITLVGRGQIGDTISPTDGPGRHFTEIRNRQRQAELAEEEERVKQHIIRKSHEEERKRHHDEQVKKKDASLKKNNDEGDKKFAASNHSATRSDYSKSHDHERENGDHDDHSHDQEHDDESKKRSASNSATDREDAKTAGNSEDKKKSSRSATANEKKQSGEHKQEEKEKHEAAVKREELAKEDPEEAKIQAAIDKKKAKEHEGEAKDPGKKAKGDGPGTQGIYSDEYQAPGGSGPDNQIPGEITEPTPEKKTDVNPQRERKQTAALRG
ncbi:hypothetical protein FPQ18DRAFT_407864, partial [Pyronema domesticum]